MAFHINSNSATSISRQYSNKAIQGTKKSIQRISSGQKIVSPSDDAAGLAIAGKLAGKTKNLFKLKENFQNSLSFLQIQNSIIENAGKMISRASELKHQFHDVTKNSSDKANYDEEFREIQLQLRELQQQKFNGVSLFASGNVKSLASSSNHASILKVDHLDHSKSLDIHRTGIFDSLFIEKQPNEQEVPFPNINGDGNETKLTVPLTSRNGSVTWNIQSGFAGDRFTIQQGTDILLDDVYGKLFFGPNPNIVFGDGFTGNASTNDHIFNKDPATGAPIPFPLTNNNPSDQLTFYVNKGGQPAGVTEWETDIKITYSSTQMSLTDGNIYSLGDFEFSEFSGFSDVISNAIAQNGSTQSRINYEYEHINTSQIHLSSAHSKINDADFAKESLRLAKFNILSQSSAKMIGQANQLTKLAIKIMGQ
ncbi:flagellin N-terminal helical domain-containing protein [Candidatus Seribacter sulfatis]|uniref:flagellin N-terminal helical domain-containing protein n=1 Tax=Candidatus Seribacter sulfatis TaxID=3381756 RepID=UPI00389AB440